MSQVSRHGPAPRRSVDDTLSPRNYEKLSQHIIKEIGIKLPADKRGMVEGRLRRRIRLLGFSNFDDYCRYLFDDEGLQKEMSFVVDLVTTHKTDFFREPEHYDLLEKRLLNALLENRSGGGRPLIKVWSAASSNGAEAYSLAMLLSEMSRVRRHFEFAVLATDISTSIIADGERAVYPEDAIAPVPKVMQDRYLMRARKPSGRMDVRIVPELRRKVQFAPLNLMDASYPYDRDIDIIFLRNVLIYFEKHDQDAIVKRLAGHLRPKGYLFLGHAESMIGGGPGMRLVEPAVFEKT